MNSKPIERAMLWCMGITFILISCWVFAARFYPLPISPKTKLGKAISGELSVEVFSVSEEAPYSGIRSQLFGGLYEKIKLFDIYKSKAWVLFLFSVLLILLIFATKCKKFIFTALCLSAATALSIIFSVRLGECVDEFFINLRHSYMMIHAGKYSANAISSIEGSVDFLPLFLTGLLGKIGFPLPEALILICASGNALIIGATNRIVSTITGSRIAALWMAVAIAFFPSLLFVGASGFSATLFSGCILFACYFCFLSEWKQGRKLGIILTSLLTLVRTEGILLAFFFWIYISLEEWPKKRKFVSIFKIGILLVLPFLLSCIIRKFYFGTILPLPIPFKATGGDLVYLFQGVQQLRVYMEHYNLHYLFLAAIFPFSIFVSTQARFAKQLIWILLMLGAFVFAYFTGGGDWLPISWNRYMMPFTLFSYIIGVTSLYCIGKKYFPSKYKVFLLFTFLIAMPIWYNLVYPKGGRADSRAFVNAKNYLIEPFHGWERVDRLAAFGNFLNQTTSKETLVASPEVATIMYFAEREMLDLLGVSNPDIAFSPLNPIFSGNILHKKRNPQTIQKHMPGVIALYEMAHEVQNMFSQSSKKKSPENFLQALFSGAFTQDRIDTGFYRAGSYPFLEKLGYHHLAVFWKNLAFNYFVHESILDHHRAELYRLGLKRVGIGKVAYSVSPAISGKFSD